MASADVDDSLTHDDGSDSAQLSENELKPRTRTSLLDSTEEFEIIDSTGEDDDLSDLPLLETVEGQENGKMQNEEKEEKSTDEFQNEQEDWIDILGKLIPIHPLSFYSVILSYSTQVCTAVSGSISIRDHRMGKC